MRRFPSPARGELRRAGSAKRNPPLPPSGSRLFGPTRWRVTPRAAAAPSCRRARCGEPALRIVELKVMAVSSTRMHLMWMGRHGSARRGAFGQANAQHRAAAQRWPRRDGWWPPYSIIGFALGGSILCRTGAHSAMPGRRSLPSQRRDDHFPALASIERDRCSLPLSPTAPADTLGSPAKAPA